MNKFNFYISGAIGGFLAVAILLVFYFSLNLFNYQLVLEPKYIDVDTFSNVDVVGPNERRQFVESMKREGLVMTPEQYTSNVVDYYNIAFLVMSAMLVVFSMIGFFHFKMSIKEAFQDMLKSGDFQESVANTLNGRAEEYYGDRFEELDSFVKNTEQINKYTKESIDGMLIRLENLEDKRVEVEDLEG